MRGIYDNISEDRIIANKKDFNEKVGRLYRDIPKQPGTLLDIGCSYGLKMEYFIERGWKAKGIDISRGAVEFALSKGLDCKHSSIESFETEEKFDVVILNNVLEHLPYPETVLKKIKGWIKEDGIVYIRVPNVESIILPDKRQSFLGDLKPHEHLFYFSKNSLEKLLTRVGFNVSIKTSGFVSLCEVINCYIRSKIVLKHSWQNLNLYTQPQEKKLYSFLKSIYSKIITSLAFIHSGADNREIVAIASKKGV